MVTQIALSLLLLVSARIFLGNLREATRIEKGFDSDNVLLAAVDPGLQGYSQQQAEHFYAELLSRMEALPGVRSVGLARRVPMDFEGRSRTVRVPGYTPTPGESMSIQHNYVSSGYFETMGIPLLGGRGFIEEDSGPGEAAIIVNEAFAERFWPGVDALGRLVSVAGPDREVIAVVGNGKYRSLGEPPTPFMYLPWPQAFSSQMTLHIRASGDPEALVSPLRDEIRAIDSNMPVYNLRMLNNHLGIALLPARVGGITLALFGVLGTALATVGIYGVMSRTVSLRTREIGVRVSLGADPLEVTRLVILQGMRIVVLGLLVGMVGALLAERAVRGLLYSQTGIDPMTFVGVPMLLAVVALTAITLTARRAAAVDPMEVLRSE